jgi:hypothetical protein
MKKNIMSLIITIGLFATPLLSTGQATSPSDPTGTPEASTPLGGSAPVGGGMVILLTLGAAYGGKKVYNLFKDDKETLEE